MRTPSPFSITSFHHFLHITPPPGGEVGRSKFHASGYFSRNLGVKVTLQHVRCDAAISLAEIPSELMARMVRSVRGRGVFVYNFVTAKRRHCGFAFVFRSNREEPE
jgi:hypothetical protein